MRILFFMPLAARTSGAERALFNLIRHAAGEGWEMAVAAGRRGELLAELPAPVRTFVEPEPTTARKVYAAAARRLLNRRGGFHMEAHARFKPDLWYVNTIARPWLVGEAKAAGVPCVLHVHELEPALAEVPAGVVAQLVGYPRLIFACSEAAREVYRALGRAADLEVSYPTLNPQDIRWSDEASARIRRGLGVGEKTFLWAMAGGFDANKNALLFVELAAEMLREKLDAHFMWLGGGAESGYSLYVKEKARALGVAEKVSFVGNRADDYYDYLNAADGAVLTSSKESFSVFTAEAAYLGKPVVAFDCGGVREIIRPGMGVVVGSRNAADLIREMASVMRGGTGFDPLVSRERVREFFVGAQGGRWLGLMRNYFEGGGERVAGRDTGAGVRTAV